MKMICSGSVRNQQDRRVSCVKIDYAARYKCTSTPWDRLTAYAMRKPDGEVFTTGDGIRGDELRDFAASLVTE